METYIYKKSYQAGVFNLYISAFKLAKQIGFKNVILWEYDYELGDQSVDFFNKNMDLMIKDKLESISFQSIITILNNDIIQFQINQEPFLISSKAPSFKSPNDKLPILIRLRETTS